MSRRDAKQVQRRQTDHPRIKGPRSAGDPQGTATAAKLSPDTQFPFESRRRRIGLAVILLVALATRLWYYHAMGVRFDAGTLGNYLQFIDPVLLKTRLLESLFYLREQPPLFNLLLGLVLKVAPVEYATVFQSLFILMGAVLAASLYWLLTEIRIPVVFATTVTVIYLSHPTTILYENWLLYEYPLTALLTMSALFLSWYVRSQSAAAGLAFFATLATLVLTRGTFHLIWMVSLVAGVAFLSGIKLRSVLMCSALPLAIAASLYVKNYGLFGDVVSGEVYRKLNYSMMRTSKLPYEELLRLAKEKVISPVSILPIYGRPIVVYQPFLPAMEPTGVPLLDQHIKSTGAMNWHHQAMPLVADLYFQDARIIDRLHPDFYYREVIENGYRYFRPPSEMERFYGTSNGNGAQLAVLVKYANLVFAGQLTDGKLGWLNLVFLPLAILYGVVQFARWLRSRWRRVDSTPSETARAAVLAYCVFNILYVSVSTILLSYGDHNRYRFCVMPLYLVLLALMGTDAWARVRSRSSKKMKPAD